MEAGVSQKTHASMQFTAMAFTDLFFMRHRFHSMEREYVGTAVDISCN